eukprot:TRINITY_DN126_c1_g1_i1.p1 TRINITY_DN126_c1_g1~~TRINITY_DN126_c1_g1_i1.p1  ORF type:complete len:708 (+),score=74.27 TRINITY_DN126_c1_g1_i1:471-2594(+)
MSSRSDRPEKGINKPTFLDVSLLPNLTQQYANVPGIIGERLFAVFDINNDGYLDITEYVTSMFKLYSSEFNIKMKLIFDMYDFDKDSFLTKEDVSLMLSHAPIDKPHVDGYSRTKEGKITQSGVGGEDYFDRAESQKELQNLVDICFGDKTKMNFEDFKTVTEKVSSEMFLCLFSLLKTRFPSLAQFKRYEQGLKKKTESLLRTPTSGRRLAAPKVLSKFSPLSQLVKFSTPKLESKTLRVAKADVPESPEEVKSLTAQRPYLSKISAKPKSGFAPSPLPHDSPIGPAVRLANTKVKSHDVTNSPSTFLSGKSGPDLTLFCECGKTITDLDKLLCEDCIAKMNEPKCEGYLLRKKKGIKKFWFCIDKKELYCYESKEASMHKSMHNLTGCFVKEEEPEKLDDSTLYPFLLVFSQIKSKRYYAATREEYKMWVSSIRKVIGYANILDYYELKESLGKGKFGIVRGAAHRKTGKRVAIKVMKKSMMTPQDVELVKQEIEILKMCQHPNLIKMLDVFENIDHIYIVMELLEGGDLFSYLEKRRFRIPEQRAARIVHSLAAGLYYLHSYGIVHRDIKPENVLMATKAEDSDVKIVDFGLSKMVGPSQLCSEPFGTLSYVAPEVLQQKPYGKEVDVWSLGVLAYLMMVGALPFDHEDDREVARQYPFFLQNTRLTIFAEPDYTSVSWRKISKEGVDFVKSTLCLFTSFQNCS